MATKKLVNASFVLVLAAATFGIGLAMVAVVGCGATTGDPTLTMTASKNSVKPDGNDSITLTIEATAADGKPGTGSVIVTADSGDFNGEVGANNIPVSLAAGRATLDYSCDATKEPDCSGQQKIQALWQGATALVKIAFPVSASADAGGGAPITIDGSNTCVLGSGFGLSDDQNRRFQTFHVASGGRLVSLDLKLRKVQGSSQTDVTVELFRYPAAGPLATATVPAGSIGSEFTKVSTSIAYDGLASGGQYAIALGQKNSQYACYEWCSHAGHNPKEDFGKIQADGSWIHGDSAGEGDGWFVAHLLSSP